MPFDCSSSCSLLFYYFYFESNENTQRQGGVILRNFGSVTLDKLAMNARGCYCDFGGFLPKVVYIKDFSILKWGQKVKILSRIMALDIKLTS